MVKKRKLRAGELGKYFVIFILPALIIYYIGLGINLIWPFIFFNAKEYLIALIWLVILTLFVILMMIEYFKIDKKAFYLQIPYILWLLFAFYLNYQVFILNR